MASTLPDGSRKPKPKVPPLRDRRLTRKLNKTLRRTGTLPEGSLRDLAKVVATSNQRGTLNNRDQKVLRRFLNNLDKHSNQEIPNSNVYKSLQSYSGRKSITKDRVPVRTIKVPEKSQGRGPGPWADKMVPHDRDGGSQKAQKGRSGKRGGRGGPNTSTPGMIYYGLGDFPGVNRKEARLEVQTENNKLIRALLDQAKNYRQDLEFDTNKANTLFDRTKGDLNYVFNEADDFIKGRNQAIINRYQSTGNEIGEVFSGLQNALGQTSNANRDAALQEQARLGIQQSGMGNFDQDANFAQLQAQQLGSSAQANLDMQRNSATEIGALLRSMGQASLASAVGRATNARQDSITGAQQGFRENINNIRSDITDVRKNRSQAVGDLHRAMEDAAYQRWAESQQMDFNNQLAANQFNLGVSKHNSDNFWERAKLTQQQAEARRRRQLAQQQMRANRESKRLDSRSISINELMDPNSAFNS